MNTLKLTTSAMALTLAGSAFAADLPSRRAPAPYIAPPPVFTWSGFYVGVNAGARFGGRGGALVASAPYLENTAGGAFTGIGGALAASQSAFVDTGSRAGAILGVQAGYNYQFGTAFLTGIEADIQGVIGSSSRQVFSGFSNGNAIGQAGGNVPFTLSTTGSVQKRTDYLGTVRARLGYSITPAFLIYATGGLAYGGVKSSTNSVTTSVVNNGLRGGAGDITVLGGQGGYSTNRVGYTIGGGMEYMFLPSFSLKAEYLYYDLGSVSYASGGAIATNALIAGAGGANVIAATAQRTRVRYDGQLARVGVNYHFWSPVAAPVVARY